MLADRDRIARDLHEHVIGRLFGIGLALHGAHRLARSPAVAARIADHIDQIIEVIAEVRAAVFDLHPDLAEIPRLGGVLTSIVEDITADTDLHTSIGFSGRIDNLPAALAEQPRRCSGKRSATPCDTPTPPRSPSWSPPPSTWS